MAQIDLAKSTVYIRDRSANYIEIKIGEGNLQYQESRNIDFVQSRGLNDTVREGNETQMEVNFDFIWEYVSSSTGATIEDALKKLGGASNWVSASLDPFAPYSVNIEIVHGSSQCGDVSNIEHIFLTEFNYEQLGHSLKDGTIDCHGRCNAAKATTSREVP